MVVGLVVVYQPDKQQLETLVRALAPQVALVVIVHNGSQTDSGDWQQETNGIATLHLGSNLGVACALNAGFAWASTQGAAYVLSFDQDSEPAPDMVAQLLKAYAALVSLPRDLARLPPPSPAPVANEGSGSSMSTCDFS